ncbi:AP3-complex subunit [Musa troglodytarum]|uniref:AP3-complex subunit n=1 Tax=Musa troglodytarum TaxID=320322 RepID=A0A9E7GI90_9LILI|nr:AP3-complex subunit [Musa troglodytarum]
MFPQFGATAESLSKASSLLLRFGTDAHLYDDPDDVNIGPLLDSRFDSEKVDALKRLLALLAQGADVSHHYPQVLIRSVLLSVPPSSYSSSSFVKPTLVELMSMNSLGVVKNVASQSLEVKKLVYLYLLHYAENKEDEQHEADLVDILLNDYSPGVVGAAAVAFKLCETLPDVEERSQIVLIEILLRYVIARHGLVKESSMFTSNSVLTSQEDENFAAFGEGQRDCSSQAGRMKGDNDLDLPLTSSTNDDVDILLQCTSPLLWSHNSAVVFGAATDYVKDPDRRFVADTVAAIGLCAQRVPMVASTCLEGLLDLTFHESLISSLSQFVGEAVVLIQAIMSIKAIIKQDPTSYDKFFKCM